MEYLDQTLHTYAYSKVRKEATISHPCNQIPHLIQGTIWERAKTQDNITYKRARRSALTQVNIRLQHVNFRLITGIHNILFDGRGFAEHQSSWSWSFIENALEPHDIFGSNCILLYYNIDQPLVCKTVMRLLRELKKKKIT